MQKYIGTKLINAKPMTRPAYNVAELLESAPEAPQPAKRTPPTDQEIDRTIAELGLDYFANAALNRAVLRELCKRAHGGGQT